MTKTPQPCPFCGSGAIECEELGYNGLGHHACGECGAHGPIAEKTVEASLALWDKRAPSWQPIESAPKDRLLLLSRFDWPRALGVPAPVKVGGWREREWEIFGASWRPTHWMPIPKTPEQEGADAAPPEPKARQ